ncbi:MAG: heme exporter protein CcmD [Burkholderiales bacterium]
MNDAYIWGSYAVTFALLGAEVVLLMLRSRRAAKAK